MLETERNYQIELMRRYAAKPVGDFIAQVSSAIAVTLCFVTFYSAPEAIAGYETPYGIVIIVAAFLCWAFSSVVLLEKLFRSDFWLARSPGWFYGLVSSVVVIVSLLGMLFPYRAGPEYGPLAGTFLTGLFMMLGSLMKF